jgi:hypothetical protein
MRKEALDILDRVTRERQDKDDRLVDLLRHPEADKASDWYMHVPPCFNDALDIKQTPRVLVPKTKPVATWTQGREFKFKAGDVIYDTPRAYEQWSEALRYIRLCVHVRSATDATSPPPPARRSPGSVTFDVLVPTTDRKQLVRSATHTLTHDAFIRFLICGEGIAKGTILT